MSLSLPDVSSLLPLSTSLSIACKAALNPIVLSIFTACGGIQLATINSDPANAISQGYLSSVCSTGCTSAFASFASLNSICGTAQIFSTNSTTSSNTAFSLLSGLSAAELSKTSSNLLDIACLKNSNGTYCLNEEVNSVTGAAANSWPPFALLPPISYCSNPTIVCTLCISDQVAAIQKDANLAAYLKPNLDAIATQKCVPKPLSTNASGGVIHVVSAVLVFAASLVIL